MVTVVLKKLLFIVFILFCNFCKNWFEIISFSSLLVESMMAVSCFILHFGWHFASFICRYMGMSTFISKVLIWLNSLVDFHCYFALLFSLCRCTYMYGNAFILKSHIVLIWDGCLFLFHHVVLNVASFYPLWLSYQTILFFIFPRCFIFLDHHYRSVSTKWQNWPQPSCCSFSACIIK